MGSRRKKKDGDRRDSYGFKISELLSYLAVERTPSSGKLLGGLLQTAPTLLQTAPTLPILPVVRGNVPTVRGTVRSRALLPDRIQRLSDAQSRRWHHQKPDGSLPSSRPNPAPAPTPAFNTPGPGKECPILVSPDPFFLPYLVAQETELRCDSLSSVKDLLCPDVLGESWRKAPVPSISLQPGGTSVQYFEDLRNLQSKLFRGVLWTTAGPHSPQRQSSVPRTLRTVSTINGASLCCSPPLVCHNHICYSAFSSPQ